MMRIVQLLALLLTLVIVAGDVVASDGKLTNAAVIKMLDAKLPERVVVMKIEQSEADFDTSTDAMIALSKRGVSEAVISAMLAKAAHASIPTRPGRSADQFDPEQIMLVDGDAQTPLRYINSSMRTAARALGFGGVATYAVLPGPEAILRLPTRTPAFIVAVPSNAQPQAYLTLARFEPRRNGTREVATGGGYMSYSTGIHRDRVIETTAVALEDQSKAPDGFTLFTLTPASALKAGEYALVTYNSHVRVSGFFASGGDSFFDFGVDG